MMNSRALPIERRVTENPRHAKHFDLRHEVDVMTSPSRSGWLLPALFVLFIIETAAAQPLPFKRAVELAVAHSSTMGGAAADQMRAYETYRETRNTYLPQVVVGSGLGASYGFPLS